MTSKMFLDMVGVITTSKLSILSTFQGGAVSAPPMSSRVKTLIADVCTWTLNLHSFCIIFFQIFHRMMLCFA